MLRKYENFASPELLQLRVLPGHPHLTRIRDFMPFTATERVLQKRAHAIFCTWDKIVVKSPGLFLLRGGEICNRGGVKETRHEGTVDRNENV